MFLTKEYGGYFYLYYKDPVSGKRRKISTRTKVKARANRFYISYETDQKLKSDQKSNLTLDNLRADIEKYIFNSLSNSSKYFYLTVFKKLNQFFGDIPVKMIGYREIEHYKTERAKKVSQTSTNIELRVLKAILNYAVKLEYMQSNPAKQVKQFKIPNKEKQYFNQIEVKKLLEVIDDVRIKQIVLIALYTGCRLNEILHLRWSDIDLDKRFLSIENTEEFKTKNRKSRKIPLHIELLPVFQKMIEIQNVNKIKNYYLFQNDKGCPFSKGFISHKFKYYLRKVGLNDELHFHNLRHTALSIMAQNNVPLIKIKEISGHADLRVLSLYLHTEIEELRKAINAIKY